MNPLLRLERRIAALAGETLGRIGTRVTAIELAGELESEAAERKLVVGHRRALVPEHYLLELHPSDLERFRAHLPELALELQSELSARMEEHGWTPRGEVEVEIRASTEVRPGKVRTTSSQRPSDDEATSAVALPTPSPAEPASSAPNGGAVRVEVKTRREAFSVTLTKEVTMVGRSEGADIRIDDRSVSRRQGEIRVRGDLVHYTDLGSTNGSRVNGRDVTRAVLQDGDRVQVGTAVLQVRIPS